MMNNWLVLLSARPTMPYQFATPSLRWQIEQQVNHHRGACGDGDLQPVRVEPRARLCEELGYVVLEIVMKDARGATSIARSHAFLL
jgi:hypothetical protein